MWFVLEHDVWIPTLMSWVSVSWWGSDTHTPRLVVWVCGLDFARPWTLLFTSVCLVLHLVRVVFGWVHSCCVLCCVAHSLCISLAVCFYAVMSCVNTWLMSFLMSVLFCTWLVICFAGDVLVFFFVWEHGFCLSFLCAMCSHVNCLDTTHLVTWLLVNLPPCLPSLPSSFAPFISLLPCPGLPGFQLSCFSPTR